MKRRVKYYKRVKNGTVYRQPWVGHSYRNRNGTPDFKREFSLAGWDEQQVEAIDCALRHGCAPEAAAQPHSKLALWETLPGSALERVIAPDGFVGELHDFYVALEDIHEKQNDIQKSLFTSRGTADRMFLYDITAIL